MNNQVVTKTSKTTFVAASKCVRSDAMKVSSVNVDKGFV
jgi:hypothetical protein